MAQEKTYPLTGWGHRFIEHIREFRPRLYSDLVEPGDLHRIAHGQQEQARRLAVTMVREGASVEAAQEVALHQFILLPSEDEQPEL
ncbi:MAG: hypothetical protein HOL45_08095 [Chloroflexi bacterium]|jgi:hypothetical protein|nr:hypothetical protein [Chloroflexota bacterium]